MRTALRAHCVISNQAQLWEWQAAHPAQAVAIAGMAILVVFTALLRALGSDGDNHGWLDSGSDDGGYSAGD